jgi:hypothetical protein
LKPIFTKKRITFHHEAHGSTNLTTGYGHEGFGIDIFEFLNFVLFVTFVVQCLYRF